MKRFSLLIIAALVLSLGVVSEAYAQYWVSNASPVSIVAQVYINCGGIVTLTPVVPLVITSGTIAGIVVPVGCTVVGAFINATSYPMGYSGPAAPPNPPNNVTVTPARTGVI